MDEERSEQEDRQEPGTRGSLAGLLLFALIVVLVIVIILLLSRCDGLTSQTSNGGDKQIEGVPVMQPVKGNVSVWIDGSVDIVTVLERAGVSSSGITDMTEGRYVVVLDCDTTYAVSRISKQAGVYDCGLVYERIPK